MFYLSIFCSAWRPSFWLVHSPVIIIIEGFTGAFFLILSVGGGVALVSSISWEGK